MTTHHKHTYKPVNDLAGVEDRKTCAGEPTIALSNWHFSLVFGITIIYLLTSLEIIRVSLNILSYPEVIQKISVLFKVSMNDVYVLYIILAGTFIVQSVCALCLLRGILRFQPNCLLPYLITFPFVVIMFLLINMISVTCRTGDNPISLFFNAGRSPIVCTVLFGTKYVVILRTFETMINMQRKNKKEDIMV